MAFLTEDQNFFNPRVEYDIFVPTVSDVGDSFPLELLSNFRKKLVDFFGGITDTKIHNEGVWKIGRVTVRDEVVIWRILSDRSEAGDTFILETKSAMELAFKQEKILIIRRLVAAT